jgi:hypothetical protein
MVRFSALFQDEKYAQSRPVLRILSEMVLRKTDTEFFRLAIRRKSALMFESTEDELERILIKPVLKFNKRSLWQLLTTQLLVRLRAS